MKIVAEGIETREQLELVANSGRNLAQGYYYAQPMPEDALLYSNP